MNGKRFGKLEVIEYRGTRIHGERRNKVWLCKCDCGAYVVKTTQQLNKGNSQKCKSCWTSKAPKRYCIYRMQKGNRVYLHDDGLFGLKGKAVYFYRKTADEKIKELSYEYEYLGYEFYLEEYVKKAQQDRVH